jgi:hypothetical protein
MEKPDPFFRRKGLYTLQWSLENLIEQKNVSVLFGESKSEKTSMKKTLTGYLLR